MSKDYLVGLKDIAQATGYSVSTVSRVIKKKGEIAESTREQILDVARKLGYHDNRMSNAIRTGKTGMIGVIMPLGRLFFAQLLTEINHELMARDYLPLVAITDTVNPNEQDNMRRLLERRVEGMIFVPRNDYAEDSYFAEITGRGLPLVAIDRKIPAKIDFVGTDDYHGGRMAAEYLYSLGHRKIGYFQGPQETSPGKFRRDGFEAFCREFDDCSLTVIGKGDWIGEEPAELKAILKKYPEITAYGAFTDLYGLKLMQAANNIGRKVPESLSLIGFANMPETSTKAGEITTFEQHSEHLAAEAVSALFERMQDREKPCRDIRIKPELIVKETTRAFRAATKK